MLKQSAILEIVRDERVYTLTLPANAPLGELFDIIFQMRSFVVGKINESMNLDKPKDPIEGSETPKTE